MNVERLALDEWAAALPSSGYDVFHAPEALSVMDRHADGALRLYGAFKGQEAVALLPVFVKETTVGRAVFSPPPSLGVQHLGPVLSPTSPKRKKRERVNREFTEAVLDRLDVGSPFTLFHMVCSPPYTDPRPYRWADLQVEPAFTYALDLDGRDADALLGSFSRSLRTDVRDGLELDVTVSVEGPDAAARVYEDVAARYAEHGESPPVDGAFVRDVAAALGDRCPVYVARDPDGAYLSGIVAPRSADTVYYWQGGASATYEGTSVNGLLHWRIITDVLEDPALDGVRRYDLVGANTPRLCRYKSQFGGELVPYYVVESSGRGMDVAKKAYSFVRK